MKLFGVETFGVRGIPDGHYSFARTDDEPHDHVLITGGPASGKTRLLELIVIVRQTIAPTEGGLDHDPFIRPGNFTARTIVHFWLTEEERAVLGVQRPIVDAEVVFGADTPVVPDPALVFLLERYAHDDETPKLEYFGEHRNLDVGGGEMTLDENRQFRYRAGTDPRKFAFVPGFLLRLQDKKDHAARFARGLAALSSTCRYDIERHVLVSGHRTLGGLDELSASEADAVAFASTATLVGLSNSIVLVDKPELHGLDPVRAYHGIAELGSNNQLVLVSSSPELVSSFRGAVVQLSPNEKR